MCSFFTCHISLQHDDFSVHYLQTVLVASFGLAPRAVKQDDIISVLIFLILIFKTVQFHFIHICHEFLYSLSNWPTQLKLILALLNDVPTQGDICFLQKTQFCCLPFRKSLTTDQEYPGWYWTYAYCLFWHYRADLFLHHCLNPLSSWKDKHLVS